MQLKITTDYAIRMILYLAQNESVIVSATEIAQAMKIPHSYLIQIGAVLKKSGLIQAHSGRLGGEGAGGAAVPVCALVRVLPCGCGGAA